MSVTKVDDIICFNGHFLPIENAAVGLHNRSFKYGDGLFETMRFQNGQILFVDAHFERLVAGMFVLGFETSFFDVEAVYQDCLKLVSEKNLSTARIRLHVYRNDGGNYKPATDQCSYVIYADGLEQDRFVINDKGFHIGLYADIRKPINSLSGIKSANGLLYVLAARHADIQNWNEALILNEQGRICECSASNVFLIMPDKSILTPALTEGCLAGVMRKNLIELLKNSGRKVVEGAVLTEDLYRAEEVFLTNAIQGIRWCIAFREKRFYSTKSREILLELQQYLG
jgi:branched-chain amino acid aminotransferase